MIESNVELCRISEDQQAIYCSEAHEFLRQTTLPAWDIVFFDPPYKEDYLKTLAFVGAKALQLLNDDGLVIVEHHHKNTLPETIGNLVRTRLLKQGDSSLSFYRRTSDTD